METVKWLVVLALTVETLSGCGSSGGSSGNVAAAGVCGVGRVYTAIGCVAGTSCSGSYCFDSVGNRWVSSLESYSWIGNYSGAYVANYGYLNRGTCYAGAVWNPTTGLCMPLTTFTGLTYANPYYNTLYANLVNFNNYRNYFYNGLYYYYY